MSAARDLPATVHATAIAIGDRGALIRGASGSGKSDLAMRCLSLGVSSLVPVAARLIGDDRIELRSHGGELLLASAAAIAGKIEMRGLGIVDVPVSAAPARLCLVADLVASDVMIERMPDEEFADFNGVRVPAIKLHPFEASAPLKLVIALSNVR